MPSSRMTSHAFPCIGRDSQVNGELQIVPETDGGQWSAIDSAVAEFSKEQGWPEDLDFTVRLILEELVLNAVDYGTDDKSTEVRLHLTSDQERVRIVVSDNGVPFNPLAETPTPDLDAAAEDRTVGGLGVHFIKTMADSATYERLEGRNRMTIVKLRG